MRSILLLLTIILVLFSCKKKPTEEVGNGTLNLRLTDSPALYEHLYLDIQEVQVNHSEKGWITVGPQVAGLYDILAYNNGIDTLLGTKSIQVGTISQIRLILGNSNSIVVNGITSAITVQGSAQSGLKININQEITANATINRWIDFDVAKSVVELGNGQYILKPVLRSYNEHENGRISGTILPGDAEPLVLAITGNDTIAAIPEADGSFKFSGLNGVYDIHFIPYNASYNGFSIYNQQVVAGQELFLGLLSF